MRFGESAKTPCAVLFPHCVEPLANLIQCLFQATRLPDQRFPFLFRACRQCTRTEAEALATTASAASHATAPPQAQAHATAHATTQATAHTSADSGTTGTCPFTVSHLSSRLWSHLIGSHPIQSRHRVRSFPAHPGRFRSQLPLMRCPAGRPRGPLTPLLRYEHLPNYRIRRFWAYVNIE